MKRLLYIIIIAALGFTMPSCKKSVLVGPPPNVITTDKVFDNDASAIAATLSDYTSFSSFDGNCYQYIGQYVDELSQPTVNTTSADFANSTVSSSNGAVASMWQYLYVTIYKANSNIEGLQAATGLTDSVKKQCLGEAYFVRAYCHFYLVNLFGDIPLITTTDASITTTEARTSASKVYDQIVADLMTAKSYLNSNYPTSEKIRPNLYAASALLARVYLYQQQWQQAENEATTVINSGVYSLSSLSSVFYKNSSEAIWQLWNANGYSGLAATLTPSATGVPTYTLSNSLLNAFESADLRKTNWTKTVVSGASYTAPYKYKLKTATTGTTAEYTMYLRLSEQYLIRSEARAQQNTNLTGAVNDLNIIRNRAGLSPLSSTLNQSQVLTAVAQERFAELFIEGCHRFFDLKRTGQLNTVMGLLKLTWDNTRSPLLPIPQGQILINAALTQNPGYN